MKNESDLDKIAFQKIRQNVKQFLHNHARYLDNSGVRLLDIAPQNYAGAREFFVKSKVYTADIDPNAGSDMIMDICQNNSLEVASSSFDVVVCTEVLEHTLQPWDAVQELYRLLKPRGTLLVSTPFDFRIHKPSPDCWRFTEMGLKTLFKNYTTVTIQALDNPIRSEMPFHYTTVAIK